jgi:hypothetical protein
MSRLERVIFFSCVVCFLSVAPLRAQGGSPSVVGTWALNLAKSDFGSVQKPTFSMIRTIIQPANAKIDVSDQITHPSAKEVVEPNPPLPPSPPVVRPARTWQESTQLFTDGRHFVMTTHRTTFSAVARWNGPTLVVSLHGTRTNESDNGTKSESPFNQQQVWTVSTNGKILQIKQTTNFGQSSNTVVYFFDRI